MPRLDQPRVPPLRDDEFSDEAKEIVAKASVGPEAANIFRTLANHPKLLKRWTVFAGHILGKNSLDVRLRELAMLRIGWLCQAEYEWAQHVRIARQAGFSDDDFRRIAAGPDADGWTDEERAVLQATDELHADAFVTDDTWAALSRTLSTEQLLDLVFTVGQYNLVSMALNTLGVQLDDGLEGFAETVG
jgi:alkylhydroperoxidase family enzyme